jgi:hypothetical protein
MHWLCLLCVVEILSHEPEAEVGGWPPGFVVLAGSG